MGLCFHCFKEFDYDLGMCPHCGEEHNPEPHKLIDLIPGTILANRYVVGHEIGSGGFGIVYRGYDMKLEMVVAIKECYINDLNFRIPGVQELQFLNKEGAAETFAYRKERFLAEARSMAKLGKHPSFVNVYEFFEANKTAYIVMEFLDGENLKRFVRRNGKTSLEFGLKIVNAVGEALSSLHALHIYHRDIAPDNIQIKADGSIKLMDLGAAKLSDTDNEFQDDINKCGFTPPEQYVDDGVYGPFLDIYALGATFYYMLVGVTPPESTNRIINDDMVEPVLYDSSIPQNVNNAIMRAMAVEKHMRYQTVEAFLKDLNGNRKVLSVVEEKKKRKKKRIFGIIGAVAIVAVVALLLSNRYKAKKTVAVLDEATISMWYIDDNNEYEEKALSEVIKDFEKEYPSITVNLEGIPEDEYREKLLEAEAKGKMPTLFESTDVKLSSVKLSDGITKVLESKQAEECLFIGDDKKELISNGKVPLGAILPVAIVINEGNTSSDYNKNTFTSLEDLGVSSYVIDTKYENVWKQFSDEMKKMSKVQTADFYSEKNKCAVCFTTTMELSEKVQQLEDNKIYLTSVSIVYPSKSSINGAYTYEWSLGEGSTAQKTASERLLSYMLGASYQNILIGQATKGVPVNKACIEKYTDKSMLYRPISSILDKIDIE